MIRPLLLALMLSAFTASAQEIKLDDFESLRGWSVVTADGVALKTSLDAGRDGKALRIDYDFTRGSGYGIVRKVFSLPLPENYRFKYSIRGEGPDNTVEFKMLDASGDNVWWVNQRNFHFPRDWKTVSLKRRHFSFAWGPAGATAPFPEMHTLEIAVTSTNGGSGTVWLDDLTFEPLPAPRPYSGKPCVTVSSHEGTAPALLENGALSWTSANDDRAPALTLDFGERREFGGLVLEWSPEDFATDYTVTTSDDGSTWSQLAAIRAGNGGRDYLWVPESDAKYVRLSVGATSKERGVALRSLSIKPLDFGNSHNNLFEAIAKESPQGRYPKYFLGRASNWTVIGVDGDTNEALMNEEGAIETNRASFSLEPFIHTNARLFTWADATTSQGLVEGYLPIPWVRWSLPGLSLEIKAFADGARNDSTLWARYEIKNDSREVSKGTLFLTARPFQVLPPYQNLNITGGAARVDRVRCGNDGIVLNDAKVSFITRPSAAGASAFHAGDITEYIALGSVPANQEIDDPDGLASAAIAYPFDLKPGESRVVWVSSAFHDRKASPNLDNAEARLAAATETWRAKLNRVGLSLPKSGAHLWDVARSNLAYVLINRDGPSIQPGSRNYERTWIRDGSLTSAAMLSFGHPAEVREFLDWFATYQYDNGKIPCCVDRRGPDPVPEHDSHGQYIFAVLNDFKYSGDRSFLERHWPRVVAAAGYIEALRRERMTEEFRTGAPDMKAKYGLLPESISHEGYSAKPMHSYWDDLFALKGLKDAVTIAEILGHANEAARLSQLRDSFRETLTDSIRLVAATKGIDYIPGCAELGDFDATSTTVALFPCGEKDNLPTPLLTNTFDRYWKFVQDRKAEPTWDAYTPYETRAIGTFVRLGQRERAHELLAFFLPHQRPKGWNHWAEVVWRDAAKQAFIGDMPHTWVGSDFLNSFRSFFVYEREEDGALVLLAGVPEEWMRSPEGVSLTNWPTHYGPLSYRIALQDGQPVVRIEGIREVPAAGVVLQPPSPSKISRVLVNGAPVRFSASDGVLIRDLPASVSVEYADTP